MTLYVLFNLTNMPDFDIPFARLDLLLRGHLWQSGRLNGVFSVTPRASV
jgi:hypothetical protein